MTWYASQMIASGAPQIVEAAQRTPILAEHLFRVTNPLSHVWFRPEIVHDLPEDGLLFVRPICDPADFMAEWVDEAFISTESFASLELPSLKIEPQSLAQHGVKEIASIEPFGAAMRAAKRLSQQTSSVVAFYYCFYWGGLPEIEFAWVFGESERALIRLESKEDRLLDVGVDGVAMREEEVLVRTLQEVGCTIPTNYFAPHTGRFPWEEYRV